MEKELILILDFHGQFNQLIARRVRECNVYSEIVPFDISVEKIKEKNPKGIIFTGLNSSVSLFFIILVLPQYTQKVAVVFSSVITFAPQFGHS